MFRTYADAKEAFPYLEPSTYIRQVLEYRKLCEELNQRKPMQCPPSDHPSTPPQDGPNPRDTSPGPNPSSTLEPSPSSTPTGAPPEPSPPSSTDPSRKRTLSTSSSSSTTPPSPPPNHPPPTTKRPRQTKPLDPNKPWPMEKGKQYRANVSGKTWFLTFPQCQATKEEVLTRLKEHFSTNLRGAYLASENHKDGTPHLHVLVRLVACISTRNSRYFDFLCEKHGNYQVAHSPQAVFNYLGKEDPSPLEYGELQKPGERKSTTRSKATSGSRKKSSSSKGSQFAADLLSGHSTLREILTSDPGYYLVQKRKLEEFASLCSVHLSRKSKRPWTPLKYQGTHLETRLLADWLNSNINTRRPFKTRQLFLSGPPNSYKTTAIRLLTEFLMIYVLSFLLGYHVRQLGKKKASRRLRQLLGEAHVYLQAHYGIDQVPRW